MFFAYQSMQPKEKAFELNMGMQCPNGAICDFFCSGLSINFTEDKKVKAKGHIFNIDDFISNLGAMSDECPAPISSIAVYSHPKLKHGAVVDLSDKITKVIPNIKLTWGSNGN
jgi:hypothetical protein